MFSAPCPSPGSSGRCWTGTIGVDPVAGIEWALGLWAMRFLLATLAVTPLKWLGLNLVRFRRQLGLLAFYYTLLHIAVWMLLYMGMQWGQIFHDLFLVLFILYGTLSTLLLLPLGADLERLVGALAGRQDLEPAAQAGLSRRRFSRCCISRWWQGLYQRDADLCRDPDRAAGLAAGQGRSTADGFRLIGGACAQDCCAKALNLWSPGGQPQEIVGRIRKDEKNAVRRVFPSCGAGHASVNTPPPKRTNATVTDEDGGESCQRRTENLKARRWERR